MDGKGDYDKVLGKNEECYYIFDLKLCWVHTVCGKMLLISYLVNAIFLQHFKRLTFSMMYITLI